MAGDTTTLMGWQYLQEYLRNDELRERMHERVVLPDVFLTLPTISSRDLIRGLFENVAVRLELEGDDEIHNGKKLTVYLGETYPIKIETDVVYNNDYEFPSCCAFQWKIDGEVSISMSFNVCCPYHAENNGPLTNETKNQTIIYLMVNEFVG